LFVFISSSQLRTTANYDAQEKIRARREANEREIEENQRKRLKELKEKEVQEANETELKERLKSETMSSVLVCARGKSLRQLIRLFASHGIDSKNPCNPAQQIDVTQLFTKRQVSRACKLLLARFHPDRFPNTLPLQKKVEYEEIYKLISSEYCTFQNDPEGS